MGRVVKVNFDQKKLLDALLTAPPVTVGKFRWAIIGVEDRRSEALPYVFGKLAKYSRDGHVTLIEETRKTAIEASAPNLQIANAPFVYLPEFSGIAYLHVWNEIQDDVFRKRFQTIIESALGGVLIECRIEPISDLRAFVTRLKQLESITEIKATVNPPNPLFGRLWKPLNDYIKKRNASEVRIREEAAAGGLQSDLVNTVSDLVANIDAAPDKELDIADAAVLMAADGYGRGTVAGMAGGEKTIVRTHDAQKSFSFPKDPEPFALAGETERHLSQVSKERNMEHP